MTSPSHRSSSGPSLNPSGSILFSTPRRVGDEDGTVLGFSITTRKRRFAPRFAVPRPVPTLSWLLWRLSRGRHQLSAVAQVRLGRTKFSDVVLTDGGLPSVRCSIGARGYAYSEAWYFGNPGHYSNYVCTASMASQVGSYPERLANIDWPEIATPPARATRRLATTRIPSWPRGSKQSDAALSSPRGA